MNCVSEVISSGLERILSLNSTNGTWAVSQLGLRAMESMDSRVLLQIK